MEPTRTSTEPPPPPPPDPTDRSRTGALWVTGTGAFLLFAAAAVFVAVRWDTFSDELKLGVLAAVTGTAIVAGRLLRRSLPAAATVLVHLGAFLIPVNSAAVCLHLGMDRPGLLLTEGLVAAGAWALLAGVERSITLWRSAAAATVVAAVGIGATTPVPAAVALAATAVAASLLGRPRPARAWALVAGLGPLVAIAASSTTSGRPLGGIGEVVADLGLAGPASRPLGVVSGLLAAFALVREGRRAGQPAWLVPAGLAATAGVVSGWLWFDPAPSADLLALALGFLGLELVGTLLRDDPFWGAPLRAAGTAAEIIAGAAPLFLAWVVFFGLMQRVWRTEPWATDPRWVLSGLVLGGAWLVADLRRRTEDHAPATLALVVGGTSPGAAPLFLASIVLGVAAGTLDGTAVAVASLLGAGFLLLGARPGTTTTVVVGLAPLPLLVPSDLAHQVPVALAACAGLTAAALRQAGAAHAVTRSFPLWSTTAAPWWGPTPTWAPAPAPAATAWPPPPAGPVPTPNPHPPAATTGGAPPLGTLPPPPAGAPVTVVTRTTWVGLFSVWTAAAAALVPLVCAVAQLTGSPVLRPDRTMVTTLALGGALAAWASGVVIGTWARPRPTDRAGMVGRLGALLFLLPALQGGSGTVAVVAGVVAALAGLDAVRADRPDWAWPAVLATPILVAATASSLGSTPAAIGIALCVTASIAAGVELLVAPRWSPLFVATGGLSAGAGLTLTLVDPASAGVALVVLGGAGLGVAAVRRNDLLAALSWVAVTVGVWIELTVAHVTATDAYVVPVAVGLLAVGFVGRRRRALSSWAAYGFPVALLGGAALLDRVTTGDGRHALLAGAVGLVAVIAGGSRRLLAPLLLGTGLLVAVTVYESLAVTRTVPTWGWLALAGSVLMLAGVVLERRSTGPLEAGRRVVDLVHERFG